MEIAQTKMTVGEQQCLSAGKCNLTDCSIKTEAVTKMASVARKMAAFAALITVIVTIVAAGEAK